MLSLFTFFYMPLPVPFTNLSQALTNDKFGPLADLAQPVGDGHQDASNAEDTLHYKVFCVAWAFSVLFHMAQSRIFTTELHYALLTLAAIALILKPDSMLRLLALISLQLYEGVVRLPYVPNHWVFAMLVNFTMLQALLYLVIKTRSLHINRAVFLRTFAPVVRVQVILLYSFVVLHKLNWGFLNSNVSCAAVLLKTQHLDGLLPVSDTLLAANIYLTLLIEALIPLLLVFRKTRNAGLLVALGFHFILAFNSLNGFYDFSGMIFAAYILFTRNSFSTTAYSALKWASRQRERLNGQLAQFSFRSVATLLALFMLALGTVMFLGAKSRDYFRIVWAVYSGLFILIWLLSLRGKTDSPMATAYFTMPHMAFMIWPIVLILNGLCPYLGLKTEASYAMFSNLRTEGGLTNHLFIPISVQVFGYQKDLVEVLSSSDPKLQKLADEQMLLPFFHFKNHIASAKPAQVVYLRNGVRHSFSLASALPSDELLQRSPFVARKLMGFRPISKREPQPCQH